MSDKTGIEWTDASWNPFGGCSIVSAGCTNCYAMKQADRIVKMSAAGGKPSHYAGTTKRVKDIPVWTGTIKRAPDHLFYQPLLWQKPRTIFVNSMSDLFHENIPDEQIDEVFAIMGLCPQHTFQVLTKRPERMLQYMTERWQPHPANRLEIGGDIIDVPAATKGDTRNDKIREKISDIVLQAHRIGREDKFYNADGSLKWPAWPFPNVWLGVSVEDQDAAQKRIPDLLKTPAAIRFLSCEPLLGPLELETAWNGESALDPECWGDCLWCSKENPPLHNCQRGQQSDDAANKFKSGLDWVIVGGESGLGARAMHPDWVRGIRDACLAAGVAFFFKQWGEWMPYAMDGTRGDWFILDAGGGLDIPDDRAPDDAAGEIAVVRAGKKNAGREIDGAIWNELPGMTTLQTKKGTTS